MRSSATAKSGAMVESAPTDTMGLDPKKRNTAVAMMNPVSATKAGPPANCDVASCSGIAIARRVTPASTCPAAFWRVTPRSRSPHPRGVERSPMGVRSSCPLGDAFATRPP